MTNEMKVYNGYKIIFEGDGLYTMVRVTSNSPRVWLRPETLSQLESFAEQGYPVRYISEGDTYEQ